MLFCAQMKPGVVSKKKQFAPYAARSIDRAIVSYVLHFERKTRETREPFLLLLLLASIRIPRMCSDEIFLPRFDQRIALIHSFSFFTTALTHSFRFVCSFLFFLPTSTVDYKFSRSKRNDVVRDPVKIDENCTSRSTPFHSTPGFSLDSRWSWKQQR